MATTTPTRPQPASAPQGAPGTPNAPNAPAAPRTPASHPTAPDTKVKQLAFAFPFLKKGARASDAAAKFTDEHEIYQVLSGHEPSGSFLVSDTGIWHGGIHITDSGAGAKLDLNQGVRSIADGHLIAYRLNRTYPASDLPAMNGQPARQVPYSTGFALVRHAMEFPKGTLLTFYSLYMHLQAFEDYAQNTAKSKPAYWSTQWKITECAKDRPTAGRNGQAPDASQQGLRVRASAPRGRRGAVIAILPQGARVTLSEQKGNWGKVKDTHGAALYAPTAGAVVPATAVEGWIFLGNENGGPVATEVMPDDAFDRVVVTLSGQTEGNGANSQGIPIKAGDLIGHLGRYDSLNADASTTTRMAHIEVFCDDGIKAFIDKGREWLRAHGANRDDWKPLGLSPDPSLLRVFTGTRLYQAAEQEGANAPKTGVVQRWSLSELARDKNNQHTEATADRSGRKVNWWRVASADATRQPISGWVREDNFAGGMVTREFAQKWVDFPEPIDDAHDAAHTMFATTKDWVDYHGQANVPDAKSEAKLSPLMKKVYRALYAQGDGIRAADDLCNAFEGGTEGYPWMMLAASRLIVKHESEWANPEKWKRLYAEIEQVDGPKPQYKEEQKRIEKLVFWDEVKAKVPGFPGPSVYHVHPIGLVGNFQTKLGPITIDMLLAVEPTNSREYYEEILPALNKYALIYSVNTPKRIAHFLSQTSHESHLRPIHEDLNFSAANMRRTYGCNGGNKNYDSACDDCKKGRLRDKLWTQEEYYAHSPEHLGNYVYADRMGNRNEESGDGYKYRGRGFVQTTGKAAYKAFQAEHNGRSSDDIQDFEKNPELLERLEYAVESAFVFWSRNDLNAVADAKSITDVTQIVNGGQNGYGDRLNRFNILASILGISRE